jgi:heat-inducible transcriptional repressor
VAALAASVLFTRAQPRRRHGAAAGQTRLKHLELVSLHDHTALLVLVTDAVKVRQQVVSFSRPVTQPELSRLANRLTEA